MNLALNIIFWILFPLIASLVEGLSIVKTPSSALWLLAFGIYPIVGWLLKMPLFSVAGFKKFNLKNWGMMFLLMGIHLCVALVLKSFAHFSYTTVLIIVVIGIQSYFSRVQRN